MNMNKNNAVLAACLCAMWLTAGLAGCAHNRVTVYKTLQGIATTVDKAMMAYADAVVAGKVDAPTQAKVRTVKVQYDVAFNTAIDTLKVGSQGPAPQDVQRLATDLVALVTQITGRAP